MVKAAPRGNQRPAGAAANQRSKVSWEDEAAALGDRVAALVKRGVDEEAAILKGEFEEKSEKLESDYAAKMIKMEQQIVQLEEAETQLDAEWKELEEAQRKFKYEVEQYRKAERADKSKEPAEVVPDTEGDAPDRPAPIDVVEVGDSGLRPAADKADGKSRQTDRASVRVVGDDTGKKRKPELLENRKPQKELKREKPGGGGGSLFTQVTRSLRSDRGSHAPAPATRESPKAVQLSAAPKAPATPAPAPKKSTLPVGKLRSDEVGARRGLDITTVSSGRISLQPRVRPAEA